MKNNSIFEGEKHMENEIAKTWISGKRSITLIIEKKIAEEYGLTHPQHVILERRKEGILIRKLQIKE